MTVLQQPIQITIFDTTLTQVAKIDDYETASFENAAYQPGQFQMTINTNKPNALFVQRGYYIMWNEDVTRCAKITHINQHLDDTGKGGETLTATGYQPWYMFFQRLVLPPSGQTNYTVSGNPEFVIKSAISDQAGPTATDSNRAFALMTIATNQNRAQAAYPSYTLNVQNTNLLDELKKICQACQIGITSVLDLVNKKIIIDVSLGKDRTPGNAAGNTVVILTTDYDDVQSVDYDDMDDNLKNFVYVRSAGTQGLQTVLTLPASSIPTAEARYEAFVDGSSYPTTDPTLTTDLTALGVQALNANQFTKFLNSQPLVYSPYIYLTDYNVMDILQAQAFNVTQNSRLISMTEQVQALQYTLTATYDKPIVELGQQVANAIAQVVANVNNSQAAPVQGSNANGTYIKFSDGTLIQYRYDSSIQVGILNTDITYAFPIAFIASPSVVGSGRPLTTWTGVFSQGFSYYGGVAGSVNGCIVHLQSAATSQNFTDLCWYAIGRWK